jgi:hypothetical protein
MDINDCETDGKEHQIVKEIKGISSAAWVP